MKRYPAYKDSGVEWIGEIPEHWKCLKLRYVLSKRITDGPHETPEFIDDGIPFLSVNGIQDGELIFEGCRYISPEDHERFCKKCIVEKDDILMGKAASIGKIARVAVDFDFSIWSPLALLKPDNNIIFPIFLEYALKSVGSQHQVEILSTSNTQKNISMDDIPKMKVILPLLYEQKQIAKYLDHKTQLINSLIEKKQKQIDLLQEQRATIINQAVTKGLNPNVKMKDSGIDWLGLVPEHWRVVRNKVIFTELADKSENGNEELLTVSHITGVTPRSEKDVNMFLAENLVEYKKCEPGDLIINTMWAWMGSLGITAYSGVVSPSYNVYRFRSIKDVHPYYYDYLYRTSNSITEITRNSKGIWSSRLRLYPEIFFNLSATIPPANEQKEIVKYLDDKNKLINKYIKENNELITKLQEYRTSLISEVVTGKIDVRDEAIP